MQSIMKLALAILTLSIFIIDADAKNKRPVINESNRDLIVENLMCGLCSYNNGLRTSSAYLLGEFKVAEATIPLMRILKQCGDENERIMAALSLYKIGTDQALFTVKQAGRFDESERVRKICNNLYMEYVLNPQ